MQPVLIGVIVTLAIQFVGLVWGAAKLYTNVSEMRQDIQQLRHDVRGIDMRSQKTETRVAVLEDRDSRQAAR